MEVVAYRDSGEIQIINGANVVSLKVSEVMSLIEKLREAIAFVSFSSNVKSWKV